MEENKNVQRKKEDTSQYGEFVCSAYHWLPIEKQKDQAREMENMTKSNNKKIK